MQSLLVMTCVFSLWLTVYVTSLACDWIGHKLPQRFRPPEKSKDFIRLAFLGYFYVKAAYDGTVLGLYLYEIL